MKKATLAIVVAFFFVLSVRSQVLIPVVGANSPYDEIHPVLAPRGDLYFTRAFHPENGGGLANPGDVWMSIRAASGEYEPAIRQAELSSEGFDLVIGFPDPGRVYVYHSAQRPFAGIFSYQRKEGSWEAEGRLEIPGFRPTGPLFSGRLSQDGTILVLSMASFDSYGNEDIYIARRDGSGDWSRLIHLGPEVNTPFQELTPSLSAENDKLFFSSNGQGDHSLQKIFFSNRLDDSFARWSVPLPLLSLETHGITLSYFKDGQHAKAFITRTTSSEGYGDIFLLDAAIDDFVQAEWANDPVVSAKEDTSEPAIFPNMQIADALPEAAVRSEVEPLPSGLSEENLDFYVSQQMKETLLGRFGDFRITGLKAGLPVVLTPESPLENFEGVLQQATLQVPGFLPMRLTRAHAEGELPRPVPARALTRMLLENIQFKRGTTEFQDASSEAEIKVVATFLQQNPSLKITLEGHTDSFGNVELNRKLSSDRANAVRDRLLSEGITFDRVRVVGYGGSRPLADNQTEEGRVMNRRVEMVILEE